ncbi:hypothetical protein H9P43_008702 [Blastocladiella emersonii ATCC 22665]|nr:hypothetical protein H9P43_008697 [Blastocladiella emersonii ATCC 22665]KAI9159362.1 hypothetical protein H9P43_008702 [Blastocladiella emersonii ATCC 22665]
MNAAALVVLVLALVAMVSAIPPPIFDAPFPVPATYQVTNTHKATFEATGKLTVMSTLPCNPMPCVAVRGHGEWSYDPKTDGLTVSYWMNPSWTISQTWSCPSKSKDMNVSVLGGCKLVSASGAQSDVAPIPTKSKTWVRQ